MVRWNPGELTRRDSTGLTDEARNDFSSGLRQGYELGSLADGLVAYYPFDGTVEDKALNHDGTDNTSAGFVSGKIGQAKAFDGNDDYVDTGEKFSVGSMDQLTMSAWIYDRGGGSSDEFNILANYDGSDGTLFRYDYSSGVQLWFGGSQHNLESGWPQGQWIHVCVTYDGSKIRYYRGGNLISTVNATESTSSSNTTKIGNRGDGQYFTDGYIDDVRIYDRVLSTAEVEALYQRTSTQNITDQDRLTSGLVGHWPLNEDGSGKAYDLSGRGNDSTSVTGTTTAAGLGGAKARSFDGSDDQIQIPDSPVGGGSRSTVTGWFKAEETPNSINAILQSGSDPDSPPDWQIAELRDSGVFRSYYVESGGNLVEFVSSETFNDGEWHFFTLVVDLTEDKYEVYLDAQNKASLSIPNDSSLLDEKILIGNMAQRNYNWKGQIQDVRFYNRTLSKSEIETLARMGGLDV
ncbi:LamG domain-containing protein [Candidatus Nanosalina sp. VS9-1]|uniref:LamG domain-containing protein n=1 Tax=Candidatus Nanosalina sp. VS9-1 TaxID=3388566 RepID=UPI0039E0624B